MFVLNLLTMFQVFQASFGEFDAFDKQLKKYPKCGQAEFQDVSRSSNILQSVGFFVVIVDNVEINLLLMLFLLCFTYILVLGHLI